MKSVIETEPVTQCFYANAEGHWKSIIYLAEQTESGQKSTV